MAAGLANIAALSLEVDYPTLASIPHSVINGYKNVLAVALETDCLFPLAEKVGDVLCNCPPRGGVLRGIRGWTLGAWEWCAWECLCSGAAIACWLSMR